MPAPARLSSHREEATRFQPDTPYVRGRAGCYADCSLLTVAGNQAPVHTRNAALVALPLEEHQFLLSGSAACERP